MEYERSCAKDRNPYWSSAKWYQNADGADPDCDYIWDTKYHLGEWYEADFDIDTMREFLADQHVKGSPWLATGFFGYSAKLLSRMAGVLGYEEDRRTYEALAERIKAAYNNVFVEADGSVCGKRHAESIRALAFGLVREDMEQTVADRLNRMLIENGYHFNSGFLSTGFLIPVLCKYGYADTAFQILGQREMPSWFYEIDCGATTVWEIWTGIDEKGEREGSQCHYSPAAVADSLFSVLAGIRPMEEAPGYKKILIEPVTGGGLARVEASMDSPYGMIRSGWERKGKVVTYSVTVPANAEAKFVLPYSYEIYGRILKQYPDAERSGREIRISLFSGQHQIVV